MPTAPISLYIDVEPERSAEWEVVARASLEFAAGIRELAYMFDPSFEFRLELLRADEGSNWLKGRMRWIRGLGYPKWTMGGVALAAGSFFWTHGSDYAFEKAADAIFGAEAPKGQVEPQRAEAIERAERAASSSVAKEHMGRVYRELEKDSAITGVGVTPSYDEKPLIIVPRGSFTIMGAHQPVQVILPGERRVNTTRGDFVIIKPVLKEGGGKWRLRGPEGEFSALIADDAFNTLILKGEAPVPLAASIHMTADLETTSQMTEDGAWRPTSRTVVKVHDIRRGPEQPPLLGAPEPKRR